MGQMPNAESAWVLGSSNGFFRLHLVESVFAEWPCREARVLFR
jgi:hypothetical protein